MLLWLSLFSCIIWTGTSLIQVAQCSSPINIYAPHLTSECKNVRFQLNPSDITHQLEYVDFRFIIQSK